jgi:2-desacetyl-2-hydroxyethyl bacteriochlorophyllide A dehydrogenase
MKQIILQEPGKFMQTNVNFPDKLSDGEALVKIHTIGICGTDLHAYKGDQPFFSYPRVIGHELGVEVMETAGKHTNVFVGDKCSVEPYLNCGYCSACLRGKTNCCLQLKVLGVHTDGGMQEYIKIPVQKLHPSGALSYEQLALVETLGIGAHAVERSSIEPQDSVLIIGAGPIGLSVLQFAQLITPHIMVMDREESRLTFCRTHMKVQQTILAGANSVEVLKDQLNGELPTIVFDATGNAESMMNAFSYVAQEGKLIFVGLFQGNVTFYDPEFHRRELSLLASRNATANNFTQSIRLMEQGCINIEPWITRKVSFMNMMEEFPNWVNPGSGVVKAMLEV